MKFETKYPATNKSVNILDANESIASIMAGISESEATDEPFYIFDVDDLIEKFKNWNEKMPKVRPFYAVKCNDDYHVLKTLALLGTGFDCASEGEIRKVLDLGVDPSRIIYANPAKMGSHLRFAAQQRVTRMTFDCDIELIKIKKHYPGADLVLRIRFDDNTATSVFGKKFGCDPHLEAENLLKLASDLGLKVIGTSFHVGSGCRNHKIYRDAIETCARIFETAKQFGFNFHLLDIGGGFPGNKNTSIDQVAHYVNHAIDEYFSDPSIEIIAEPGRYFVASAFTLATNVHSKKLVKVAKNETCMMYYINDGVFGALNCVINDQVPVSPTILGIGGGDTRNSTIWGPTCDGLDAVCENIQLTELEIGDWIFWENLGAYSLTIACNFNNFAEAKVYPYVSQKHWTMLKRVIQLGSTTCINVSN